LKSFDERPRHVPERRGTKIFEKKIEIGLLNQNGPAVCVSSMSTKHQGGSGEVREPSKQGKNDSWSKAGRNVLQQHYLDMLNGQSAKLIKKMALLNAGLPVEAATGSSLHTGHLISPNSSLESIPRDNTQEDASAPTTKFHTNNSPPRIQETTLLSNEDDHLPQPLVINSAPNRRAQPQIIAHRRSGKPIIIAA
jgi:hypothetical protein